MEPKRESWRSNAGSGHQQVIDSFQSSLAKHFAELNKFESVLIFRCGRTRSVFLDWRRQASLIRTRCLWRCLFFQTQSVLDNPRRVSVLFPEDRSADSNRAELLRSWRGWTENFHLVFALDFSEFEAELRVRRRHAFQKLVHVDKKPIVTGGIP